MFSKFDWVLVRSFRATKEETRTGYRSVGPVAIGTVRYGRTASMGRVAEPTVPRGTGSRVPFRSLPCIPSPRLPSHAQRTKRMCVPVGFAVIVARAKKSHHTKKNQETKPSSDPKSEHVRTVSESIGTVSRSQEKQNNQEVPHSGQPTSARVPCFDDRKRSATIESNRVESSRPEHRPDQTKRIQIRQATRTT